MRFPYGHAAHSDWRMAAASVLEQLRAQMAGARPGPAAAGYARSPTLGLLYVTDHYAMQAQEILDHLGSELRMVSDWSGTVGIGVSSNNIEYFDQPALAVMLCELPSDQYRVFSGVAPLGLGFDAHAALVHADASTPDLAELIGEMAQRTSSGYLFGGLASSRGKVVQFALAGDGNIKGQGRASGVFSGGLSGVAFGPGVDLVSRVTQGCQPLGGRMAGMRDITGAERNLVTELDGEPALDVLLRDLNVSLDDPQRAMAALRATLVGLSGAQAGSGRAAAIGRHGNFGPDVTVRHIIGLDPARKGVAIADLAEVGMRLAFCQRNAQAARADLTRICAEIREELDATEPAALAQAGAAAGSDVQATADAHQRGMAGAIYVSCTGRGGPHFGQPSAELQIVRRALGDVPLVGFFAGGEIARHQLYGYTGVLTVFASGKAD
jgi:small ligand-binding sensory domain FIST